MPKWMNKYWTNESRSRKAKNVALVFAVIAFMIIFASSVISPQGSITTLSYTLDKLLILFTGLTILSASVYFQRDYDESIESDNEPDDDTGEVYTLEISTLIQCSHNLDKVRSNLRTGIIFVFGIGVALLAWFQNYGSILGDVQSILLMGSGVLVLCTIIAILFSFSNPIVRLQLHNIGEGLASTEMTKSEYQKTLTDIINEKESHLGRMRSVMQLGLMMFIIMVVFGFISSSFYQPLPAISDSLILGLLSFLNLCSIMSLIFGSFTAIVIIFGRTVFALTD